MCSGIRERKPIKCPKCNTFNPPRNKQCKKCGYEFPPEMIPPAPNLDQVKKKAK